MRGGDASASRPANAPAELLAEPTVFCPFLPRISPHVAEVQRYAVEWAARHRFLTDSAARSGFARSRFAYLMARAYPAASYSDLCLAVAWLTFTFALDDHFETALGVEPDRQRRAGVAVLAYLRGEGNNTAVAGLLGPRLAGGLADVWTRATARTGPAWRDKFVGHVAEYLRANAWEAANRAFGRIPDVEEYVVMRRRSAATGMFFDFIEVFADLDLGSAVADSRVLAMRAHADNAVAWFNDLVSWRKEQAAGDPHNLVLVLHRRHGMTMAEAIRTTVAWHDREVRGFLALRDGLPAEFRKAVYPLADGLGHWIRANIDWSYESGRYEAGRYE
jgi:hypothetical protein